MFFLRYTALLFVSGNLYNIPILIALPLDYPTSAPIVSLRPNKYMEIAKNHPLVDSTGIVRHEYLTDWKVNL